MLGPGAENGERGSMAKRPTAAYDKLKSANEALEEQIRAELEREYLVECSKLRANGWQNLAIALVTAGIFAPAIALLLGFERAELATQDAVGIMVVCGFGGVRLVVQSHYALRKGLYG